MKQILTTLWPCIDVCASSLRPRCNCSKGERYCLGNEASISGVRVFLSRIFVKRDPLVDSMCGFVRRILSHANPRVTRPSGENYLGCDHEPELSLQRSSVKIPNTDTCFFLTTCVLQKTKDLRARANVDHTLWQTRHGVGLSGKKLEQLDGCSRHVLSPCWQKRNYSVQLLRSSPLECQHADTSRLLPASPGLRRILITAVRCSFNHVNLSSA